MPDPLRDKKVGEGSMDETIRSTASAGYDRDSRFMLVVESDANSLFYTSMLLQRFDFRICMAASAEEALAMVPVAVPSLIITALDLKGMNGLELMQKLAGNPATASVPVIVLTKQGDLVGDKRCREAGAVDCLDKPVKAEQIFRSVEAAVETTPRSSIRIRTRLPVTVTNMPFVDAEGASVSVLSEHGMFLRTLRPAPPDTRLSLQIGLNDRIIAIEAVVRSSYRIGEGPYSEPGMGLQFVRTSPQDQELIRQFIRNEVTRGIKPM
jgi:two-component system, OmpR family, alkaline phosphatase synthesis response regulator PhoP